MADSSEIDNAVVAKLGGDATLLALCPNGVFMDEAPPNSTRFVIVSLVAAFDEGIFQRRGFEEVTYLVKAVMLSTAGGNIKSAAARIDALLEQQPLTATGYAPMTTARVERVRATEVDEVDTNIRWYHRGGRYQVQASAS